MLIYAWQGHALMGPSAALTVESKSCRCYGMQPAQEEQSNAKQTGMFNSVLLYTHSVHGVGQGHSICLLQTLCAAVHHTIHQHRREANAEQAPADYKGNANDACTGKLLFARRKHLGGSRKPDVVSRLDAGNTSTSEAGGHDGNAAADRHQ